MKRRNRSAVFGTLPATPRDIREQTGLGVTTIWRWLKDLHQSGEIHIERWVRGDTPGPWLPVYAPGEGRDARKPTPKTDAQVSRAYRARARRSGEWEHRLARQRARYWAGRARPDPLLVALVRPEEVK